MWKLFRKLFVTDQPLKLSRELLRQGRAAEAVVLLQDLVATEGPSPMSCEMLGRGLCTLGRYASALPIIESGLVSAYESVGLWVALGICREGLGEPLAALRAYEKGQEVNPRHTETTVQLCRLLCELGDVTQALRISESALSANSADLNLILCRANVLTTAKMHQDASFLYHSVLAADEYNAVALSNLSVIAISGGLPEEAERLLQLAVDRYPKNTVFQLQLAQCLCKLRKYDEALRILLLLRQIVPEDVNVHLLLGDIAVLRQKFTEATSHFGRAALLDTVNPLPYLQLGKVFFEIGNYSQAFIALNKSLAIKKSTEALWVAGLSLYREFRIYEAIEYLQAAADIDPDNTEGCILLMQAQALIGNGSRGEVEAYRKALELDPSAHMVYSNLLFTLSYDSSCSQEEYLNEALKFGKQLDSYVDKTELDIAPLPINTEGMISIGMVSGDLHMHPVGFFLEALLANLKSVDFRVHIYSNSFKEDHLTERLKTLSHNWTNIRYLDDKSAVQVIRDHKIDILFDLSGHTGKFRPGIFAIRAAPVQITWLGYWASTGIKNMDFIIADPYSIQESDERYYCEKVVRLPVTRLCFGKALETSPPVTSSPFLRNKYITFGCLQSLHKINLEVISTWAKIMEYDQNSRLILRNMQFFDSKTKDATHERFLAAGLPMSRIKLLPPLSREAYLDAYSEIDICLDTFPFPGGTTTCDALWMGVPTITIAGYNMIGRQGAALLTAAGMSDWVATDVDGYIELAKSWCSKPIDLDAIRSSLRTQVASSPLFDGPRFARDFSNLITSIIKSTPH